MTKSTVKFGIVGTNFISDWIIEGGREDNRFEVAAVYSRTQEKADAFAKKHNIPHTFTSLEAMADSNLIDAVYIASPNFLHTSQSILFLNHGKHVLCEKTFASNLEEATRMVEAARSNNRVLMEAMKPTLTPNFTSVLENLHKIGTIRSYFSCYYQYSSRYDKFKAGEILNAFKAGMSNGAMMDIGVYTIYPMVVLFGKPNKINASGILLSTGVDGEGSVHFEYDDMLATVIYSKISDSSLPTEIQGENGNITLDRINTINNVTFTGRHENKENLTRERLHNEYHYEVAEFIDLILSGKSESSINSHANTLLTMEILDEIRRQIGNK